MKHSLRLLALAGLLLSSSTITLAGTISCGDTYRTASLSSATTCYSQTIGSTAKVGNINSIAGGNWTQVDALTSSGTDGWFSITGTGWGKGDADGTWSISNLFWQKYSSALISMHVGGGQKDAVDNFEWILTPASLNGTWSYDLLKGKGGGLSNIKLWGIVGSLNPEPTPPVVTPPVVVVPPQPPVTPPTDPVPPVTTPPVTPPSPPVTTPDPTPVPPVTPPQPIPPVVNNPEPAPVPPVVTSDPTPVPPVITPDPTPVPPVTPPQPIPPVVNNPEPVPVPPVTEPEPPVVNPPLPPVETGGPLPPPPVIEPQPPVPVDPTPAPTPVIVKVPEPATLALLTLGLVALLFSRRRQAKVLLASKR